MQQLSVVDAMFLYMETQKSPMHVSSLAIYDPATAPDGKVRFKQIIEHYHERAHLVRCLRQKVRHVPLALDHPWWINDADFDAEFHIRHLALPSPGDWRQLCIQIARLHSRPLDRARPLWEAYVIEGLDHVAGLPAGCFAIFSKTHHAAIDGQSSTEMMRVMHDLSPEPQAPESGDPWHADNQPSALELIARAQLNLMREPVALGRLLYNTAPGLARTVQGLREGRLHGAGPVPRTPFNAPVSPHRVLDGVAWSLDDVKAIKNQLDGVTINDAALTICGGALHHYLAAHGDLPEESLIAMAPISVRSESQRHDAGNRVSSMSVELHTEIKDAAERLLAVNADTRRAKELTNAIGASTLTDYTQNVPAAITGMAGRLVSRAGLANRVKPIFNTVVTNVPGPQHPLYMLGAEMVANYGYLPSMDGCGLGHVISSYDGRFFISITACREMMPDPAFYTQCLQRSFLELQEATGIARSARKSAKPARRRRASPKTAASRKVKAKAKPVREGRKTAARKSRASG